MEDHLGVGKGCEEFGLDGVGDPVRGAQVHPAIQFHMQLDELGRAGFARAQVVQALDFGMVQNDGLDPLARSRRQLVIHEHLHRAAADAVGMPAQIERHGGTHRRIDPHPAELPREQERGDDREVGQQVGAVVHAVGIDRLRAGAAHDVPLEADQGQRGHDRHGHHADCQPVA